MPTEETKIAVLETEVKNLVASVDEMKGDVKEIKDKLDDKYATKEELGSLKDDFNFWRNILVACVSTALVLSLTTLIAILFKVKLL